VYEESDRYIPRFPRAGVTTSTKICIRILLFLYTTGNTYGRKRC